MENLSEKSSNVEQQRENFPVEVLTADNPGDDATITSLIDLYKNRKGSFDEFLNVRGLTSVTDFREHLKKSGMIFLLAKSDGKVVGARIVNAGRTAANGNESRWLHSLWVDENFRRRGVSTALETKTEDMLRAISKQTKRNIFMLCQIDEDNKKSHGSHEKAGWKKDQIFESEGKMVASWYKNIVA